MLSALVTTEARSKMKHRTKESVRSCRYLAATNWAIAVGVVLLFHEALAQAADAGGKPPPPIPAAVSARVRAFVNEPWNNTSLTQGLAIISDTKETPSSRAAAMQVLHANRKKLSPDETRGFLGEVTRLAKDAFNLMLCLYSLGDKVRMKDCFTSLLTIEIPGFTEEEEEEMNKPNN